MSPAKVLKPATAFVVQSHALQRKSGLTLTRSPDVKTCQVGYRRDESKWAMLTAESTGVVTVRRVLDQAAVLSAAPGPPLADVDTGDVIRGFDFSSVRQPGRYVLEVPGVGCGDEFAIADDVYSKPFELVMQSFTGQRCGIAVNLGGSFAAYRHDACHLGDAVHHASSGIDGTRRCSGGWHDAGDYGRYVVNAGITTATLLWMYECYEPKLARWSMPSFEAGPFPDVLVEIRWSLDWMLQMQDGSDGGVWHKATSADFCGFIPPEADRGEVLIIGSGAAPFKTTPATASFAACLAAASRMFRPFDAAYADTCLLAAERAWAWAISHPDALFENNPPGILTGGYGDHDATDELLWAAAELLRATDKAAYRDYFREHYGRWETPLDGEAPQAWNDVRNMAMFAYALAPQRTTEPHVVERIVQSAVKAADGIVARSRANGYRIPLTSTQYVWGSNSLVANYAMMLLIVNRLAPRRDYVDSAFDAAHYLLGRNTFATSFVTQVGVRWPKKPHHRPSGADDVEAPWPGLLVGGPNADNGLTPPGRQWFDVEESYRTNEVAINWNAPLAFLLAAGLPDHE